MKWFEFFHDATVSNGHATSFSHGYKPTATRDAVSKTRRIGSVFGKNITRRTQQRRSFSLRGIGSISQNQHLANRGPVALERQTACPFHGHASLKPQVASPDHRDTGSSCRPPNGRRATDLPMVCLHTGLVGRVAAPTAKTTRNARDSRLGWPHIQLHQHWFDQRSRPRRAPRQSVCRERELFSFDVGSLSNSGPDARFSTYHLSVNLSKKQAVIPYFPGGYLKDARTAQAGPTKQTRRG